MAAKDSLLLQTRSRTSLEDPPVKLDILNRYMKLENDNQYTTRENHSQKNSRQSLDIEKHSTAKENHSSQISSRSSLDSDAFNKYSELTAEGRNSEVSNRESLESSLVVLAFANKALPGLCAFVQSALRVGIQSLYILGWEKDKEPRGHEYYLGSKITISNKFLQQMIKKNDSRPVLFCDATDTIFQEGPKTILSKFQNLKRQIVIGTENDCWPPSFQKNYKKYYNKNPVSGAAYRYMNSGFWMASSASVMCPLLEEATKTKPEWKTHDVKRDGINTAGLPPVLKRNDQIIFASLYFMDNRPFPISLDHNAELSQAFHLSKENFPIHIVVNSTGVFNRIAGTRPSTLHFNGFGPAKKRMKEIVGVMETVQVAQQHYVNEERFTSIVTILNRDMREVKGVSLQNICSV